MSARQIKNRERIIDELRKELVGPAPDGQPLDTLEPIVFPTWRDSWGPWRDRHTGEEILTRDYPSKRYGIGVLYPYGAEEMDDDQRLDEAGPDSAGFIAKESDELTEEHDERFAEKLEDAHERLSASLRDEAPEDFDLSLANSYRPSSIAISFLAEFPPDSELVVEATGGRYTAFNVDIQESEYSLEWWVRHPVSLTARFTDEVICKEDRSFVSTGSQIVNGTSVGDAGPIDLRIEVYSRSSDADGRLRLITVCLVNRTHGTAYGDESCLFQSSFRASVVSPDTNRLILPYPEAPESAALLDPEEEGLRLLYRNAATFATGHGSAADWGGLEDDQRAEWVRAEPLPEFETPSITPDVWDKDGNQVEVPMAPLAGLDENDDGFQTLERVVELYEEWITARWVEVPQLAAHYQRAAESHLRECERCASRMRRGLAYLRDERAARRAFQLANYAVLLQQASSSLGVRRFNYNQRKDSLSLTGTYQTPDPLNPGEHRGSWRAFQIAFLLMTIESAAEGDAPERDTVELIWFPTGGGKTEAYLGLIAFALFMRRLRNPHDSGVHVIMRYTLRLLSTQQFQRAARLILAMEYLRRRHPSELGNQTFSIGLWVGSASTPNTHKDAVSTLNALEDPKKRNGENRFVIDSCPWCGAQMGPVDLPWKSKQPRIKGYYKWHNKKVRFECPDPNCEFGEFNKGLPIYVVDEDIYEIQPSMVIGTVDKFASLAWVDKARSLFGIDADGCRVASPPGLIIQDELHLISGPLGSMVGLYEAVIEELCTDRRGGEVVKPKIVSSTATIRRYHEQIRALYARNDVVLFPPPGLDASDSFFARYARDAEGNLLPGRAYVGIHAPGLGSLQTVQVRTFVALLQAPMVLSEEERDPWWTLMLFFNSLRELGTSLSLLEADIKDYQKTYMRRLEDTQGKWRSFWNVMELTGRASSDLIPKAIAELSIEYPPDGEQYPVDVCLASSILEVGVDISRLSLMVINGQPKTTSQYIQVTGRVGRQWWSRPGLIATIYTASKPRDRSHYEKFRSYHERLYAQVEPTSVTPFSPPALDRALHAVMVAYVRQTEDGDRVERPYPYPRGPVENLKRLLLGRVENVDPDERRNFERVFERRAKEWERWQRNEWSSWKPNENVLMYSAGSYVPPRQKEVTWSTPLSMRNVDAECLTELLMHVDVAEREVSDAE